MENQFKLAITPNYGNFFWRIVIFLICVMLPIILFGVSLEKELINPSSIKFELVFPSYLLVVAMSTFLIIRKSTFTDTIMVSDGSIEIPKLRTINYDEIVKMRAFTPRKLTIFGFTSTGFTSYIITLKNGRKLAIGPSTNFSTSAEKEFRDFIVEIERKVG